MPTPDFVLSLREKIGHELLWLPGITGVVFNGDDQVLLVRRADNGRWTLITGMLDPGEEPAAGTLREIHEETGVTAEIEHLIHVGSHGPITFANGDACTFLNVAFRCRYVSGQARVNDDESTDVGWFSLDRLPPLSDRHTLLLKLSLEADGVPDFKR